MEDLLQIQIKEYCKLTLPEGLKELMSDISREVLRAEPADIYGFIASYLAALLVTRDNIAVATQICNNVCDCDNENDLIRELGHIGLSPCDAEKAHKVIMQHISLKNVNEANLMSALLEKTSIEADMLPTLMTAVRSTYMHYHDQSHALCEDSEEHEPVDDVTKAVNHTLKLYRQAGTSIEEYSQMAQKIQTSYRAYFSTRQAPKSSSMSEASLAQYSAKTASSYSVDLKSQLELTTSMNRNRMNTISSVTLAGSFFDLPKYVPYNVYDSNQLSELEETTEKEHCHIDYTEKYPHLSIVSEEEKPKSKQKRISFQNDEESIINIERTSRAINYGILEFESVEVEGEDITESYVTEDTEAESLPFVFKPHEDDVVYDSKNYENIHTISDNSVGETDTNTDTSTSTDTNTDTDKDSR